jgi:rhodanese-related sulfurtransferase
MSLNCSKLGSRVVKIMSEPSNGKSGGLSTAVTIALAIIFLAVGLSGGYIAGTGLTASRTTTTTQTITVTSTTTNLGNLVNYWARAYASPKWVYFQLSRTQLVPLLNAGNSSIYIIDVRQATGNAGYATGHIAGAHNIPFQNMSAAVAAGLVPQNKIIIDVCYTGQTGAQTTAILRALGYTAYNLSGGMAAWNNATRVSAAAPIAVGENYPIVTGTSPGVWTVFNP